MPLYQVEYTSPLTRSEKNDLAASITQIHQSAYGAPSIFIGVTFKDISAVEYYAGSKLVSMNAYHIIIFMADLGGLGTYKISDWCIT
jgi:phenylpyruvate tautomerase PptA (4-oxalocrotonate tautomerase family)